MNAKTIKENIERYYDCKVNYINSNFDNGRDGGYIVKVNLVKENFEIEINMMLRHPVDLVEELGKILKTSYEQKLLDELEESEEE